MTYVTWKYIWCRTLGIEKSSIGIYAFKFGHRPWDLLNNHLFIITYERELQSSEWNLLDQNVDKAIMFRISNLFNELSDHEVNWTSLTLSSPERSISQLTALHTFHNYLEINNKCVLHVACKDKCLEMACLSWKCIDRYLSHTHSWAVSCCVGRHRCFAHTGGSM